MGFIWNYNNCDHCAIGLARKLWQQIPDTDFDTSASIMAKTFAMPYGRVENIFMGTGSWVPTKIEGYLWWEKFVFDHKAVTPEMVADQIDKYIAEVK